MLGKHSKVLKGGLKVCINKYVWGNGCNKLAVDPYAHMQ